MANRTGEYGFTLIDASIVLLVIGILMAPILKKIDIEFFQRKMEDTNSRLSTIYKAIDEYYFIYKSYPCPADPELSPSEANYGTAVDCHTNGWLPGGGAGGTLSYGSVPFKDLKIDSGVTLDKWGNKILYAVSTGLTTDPLNKFTPMNPDNASLTFMGWQSALSVPSDPASPLVWSFIEYSKPAGKGHYILISTGNQGIGGYTADGTLIEPCPAPPNDTAESENCDRDNVFNLYRYRDWQNTARARSDVPGPNYYDDLTAFSSSIPHWMWNSSSSPADIFTEEGRVGVGVIPDPAVALDVGGNIRAETDALAAGLCDGDGIAAASAGECFASSLIAGNEPEMECDPTLATTDNRKTPMVGIVGSTASGTFSVEVDCNSSPSYLPSGGFTPGYTFNCPAGQYVIGVNADGVICGS